ncbi:MAG: hypothetical protein Q9201_004072 [Fulgogasparrea decipioides]
MTTFQSVNVGLGPHEHHFGVTTPTTPRAPAQSQSQSQPATIAEEQSTATPTRLSFSGLSGQRPLPTSPFRSSLSVQSASSDQSKPDALSREHSHRSTHSIESQDVDMTLSDEEEPGSDDESVDAETGRPTKKKKGQKFYCTDFPPCNLSFTRSEHLARHISTPRPCMLTKRSPETRWPLQGLDSRGRYEQTGCGLLLVDRGHPPPVVKETIVEVTAVICQRQALARRLLPSALAGETTTVGVLPR